MASLPLLVTTLALPVLISSSTTSLLNSGDMSPIGMLTGAFLRPISLEAVLPPVGPLATVSLVGPLAVCLCAVLLGFFGFGFGFGFGFTPPVMDLAQSSSMLLFGIC